jgi:hypothetical protein
MTIRPVPREVEKIMAEGWNRPTAEAASISRQLKRPDDGPGSESDMLNRWFAAFAHSISFARYYRLQGCRTAWLERMRTVEIARRCAGECLAAVKAARRPDYAEQGALL